MRGIDISPRCLSSGKRTNGPCKERGVCDGKKDWSVGTSDDSTLDPDPKEEANWTMLVAEKYPSEGISERTDTSSSWITSPLQISDWQEYVSLSTVSENPNKIKLISFASSSRRAILGLKSSRKRLVSLHPLLLKVTTYLNLALLHRRTTAPSVELETIGLRKI